MHKKLNKMRRKQVPISGLLVLALFLSSCASTSDLSGVAGDAPAEVREASAEMSKATVGGQPETSGKPSKSLPL